MSSVNDRVFELLEGYSPLDTSACGESRLIEDLGFTSLSLVELAFAVEDLFEVEAASPDVLKAAVTGSDIVKLVAGHVDNGDGRVPTEEEVRNYLERYGPEC